MSLTENPLMTYMAWHPNKAFEKFFQDMQNRRIPAESDVGMRVTDTSPPGDDSSGTGKSGSLQNSSHNVNYSSSSEVIVNMVQLQIDWI